MTADTLDELHAMAQLIGLRTDWFQHTTRPHYDLTAGAMKRAIACGAIVISVREFVEISRALWPAIQEARQ